MESNIVDMRRLSQRQKKDGHWIHEGVVDAKTCRENGGKSSFAAAASLNFPDEWRRWIVESLLLRVPERQIVATLVENRFDPEVSAAEVAAAVAHPYVLAARPNIHRLRKLELMLDAHHHVASLSRRSGVIERRGPISRTEFLERYYSANFPVVLTGLMNNANALTRWTPSYLKQTCGSAKVEIMAGRNKDARYEINSQQHKRSIRFDEYVDMVTNGGPSNDYYLVANNGFLDRPETRPLLADLSMYSEFLDPTRTNGQIFFWYGPAGTVTPLHHDLMNVWMTQIHGKKRVLLVAPDQTHLVYNRVGVYSDVDAESPDDSQHPLFRQAQVLSVDVEPGEVLFLPVGWWHHVRSLSVSISVSYINFAFPNQFTWE